MKEKDSYRCKFCKGELKTLIDKINHESKCMADPINIKERRKANILSILLIIFWFYMTMSNNESETWSNFLSLLGFFTFPIIGVLIIQKIPEYKKRVE